MCVSVNINAACDLSSCPRETNFHALFRSEGTVEIGVVTCRLLGNHYQAPVFTVANQGLGTGGDTFSQSDTTCSSKDDVSPSAYVHTSLALKPPAALLLGSHFWGGACSTPGQQGGSQRLQDVLAGTTNTISMPYLVGHILVATLVGVGLPSRWLHWVPLGCPTGWLLAVLVLGFCCPEVQPV